MAHLPDFDAADLAGSILGLEDPTPPQAPAVATKSTNSTITSGSTSRPGSAMGWLLLAVLVIAVSVAISLAVQLGPETGSPPDPICGGLYSDCCFDDDAWVSCNPEPCDDFGPLPLDDGRGLFDAEDRFAERPPLDRC